MACLTALMTSSCRSVDAATMPLLDLSVRPSEKSSALPWQSVTLPPASATSSAPDAWSFEEYFSQIEIRAGTKRKAHPDLFLVIRSDRQTKVDVPITSRYAAVFCLRVHANGWGGDAEQGSDFSVCGLVGVAGFHGFAKGRLRGRSDGFHRYGLHLRGSE